MEELIIENQMLREKVNHLQKKLLFFVKEEFVEDKNEIERNEVERNEVERKEVGRKREDDNVFSSKKPNNFYTSLRPLTKKEIQYIHRYVQYLKLLK